MLEPQPQRKQGPEQSKGSLEQKQSPETGAVLALEIREAELDLIGRGQAGADDILSQLAKQGIEVKAAQADDILPLLRQAYQLRPELAARASTGETLSEENQKHLEGYQAFLGSVESATVTARIDRDYAQAEANLSGPEEAATRRLFERVKDAFFGAIPLLAGLGAAPAFAGDASGTSQPVELISSGVIGAGVVAGVLGGVALAGYSLRRHQTLGPNPSRREQSRWFGTGFIGVMIALGSVGGGIGATALNNGLEISRRMITNVVSPLGKVAEAKAETINQRERVHQEKSISEQQQEQARRPQEIHRSGIEGEQGVVEASRSRDQSQREAIEDIKREARDIKIGIVVKKIEGIENKLTEKTEQAQKTLGLELNKFRAAFTEFQVGEEKQRVTKRDELLAQVAIMQHHASELSDQKQRATILLELDNIFFRIMYF